MNTVHTYFPKLEDIRAAAATLEKVSVRTPLMQNLNYSKAFDCTILLKREDLQLVRSYKIRGAYNKISSLSEEEKARGIVCASAGNHAQGVAYSCNKLKIKGTIFMPIPTPKQKVEQVVMFGGEYIDIVLSGDSYDDSHHEALEHCNTYKKTYVHPFDDEKVIEGQATVALELLEQTPEPIDYLFVPIGGGGLAAGLCAVFSLLSPATKIIGVEPLGAPSMGTSIRNGFNTELETIEKFVDGAAVKRVGDRNFEICQNHLAGMVSVHEGKVCQIILDLYNKEAIVAEPAGVLSVAALDGYRAEIEGKNVVCIISGSNNDILRTPEIKERALLYANLKHYFIVRFPQRAGALKEFVAEILGPEDDITHFEYSKKHNRENGPAVVGIELKRAEDLAPLIQRMKDKNFYGDYLNEKPDIFQFLI
jgi:threonine dehydratase